MHRNPPEQFVNPTFTVFTATYNRGHILHRVYEALLSQTLRDFEWLIVDDGSIDDTELLVKTMISEGLLRIRYIKKPNGGVHTAHNVAIRMANGKFFVRLDSDDACVANALETFLKTWKQIPEERKHQYSGVGCLCMQSSGQIVGDLYPTDSWDSDYDILQSLHGEKWGFHLTDLLRRYPFPEFPGEKFCPEGLIWARLHDNQKTRCINVALRIYFNSDDSISSSMTKTRYGSPTGVSLYYNEQMKRLPLRYAFRHAINFVRFTFARKSLSGLIKQANCKSLALAATPIALILHLRDRVRGDKV